MADVILKCGCGREMRISEYADIEVMTCPDCGSELQVPRAPPPMSRASDAQVAESGGTTTRLRLKKTDALKVHLSTTAAAIGDQSKADASARIKKRAKARKKTSNSMWPGVLIGLVGGLVLAYIRYLPELPPNQMKALLSYHLFHTVSPGIRATLVQYGLYGIGILYLATIFLSWKDEMFQGLLCSIVPLYPFYYLIVVSDQYVLKGIMVALLAGFGWDLGVAVVHTSSAWVGSIDRWIASGGS